jgi:hypothetical protein
MVSRQRKEKLREAMVSVVREGVPQQLGNLAKQIEEEFMTGQAAIKTTFDVLPGYARVSVPGWSD